MMRITILALALAVVIAQSNQCSSQDPDVGFGEPSTEMSANGRVRSGRNPNDPFEMIEFLRERRIQETLALKKEQIEALQKLYEEDRARNSEAAIGRTRASLREYVKWRDTTCMQYLDEVLTPDQKLRLTQIAYRTEIQHIGLAAAMSNGRLSEALGIVDNQREALKKKLQQIEAETEAKIIALKIAAENAALKELSTEQRAKASEILGEFYLYKPVTGPERMLQFFGERRPSK